MRPHGSPLELEHRRKLIVHRVLDDGYSVQDVCSFFDIDPSSVRRWLTTYKRHGDRGLESHPVSGRPLKLSRFQEKIVGRWIHEKPTVFGFRNELWSAGKLSLLIQQEFGVHFNADYLTEWLRQRHFTPQKPQRVPKERDPKAIAYWLKHDWPRIKRKAARKRAYLALIDESGLLMAPLLKRSWAPRGHPPTLLYKGGGRSEKVSIVAAISLNPRREKLGLFYKTLINDYFDNFYMAGFLEGMLRSVKSPLIVVWDGGRNHFGAPLRELKGEYPDRLIIEDLPPYAPIINPVEAIWSWLKYGKLSNFVPKDVWELDKRAVQELTSIQTDQKVLRNLFHQSELPLPRALVS